VVFASNEREHNIYFRYGREDKDRCGKVRLNRKETGAHAKTEPSLFKQAGGRRVPHNHTLKLSPQEQEALALGFVNLKPPPIILSEKSSTVPLR
jgi:hypothetical protein